MTDDAGHPGGESYRNGCADTNRDASETSGPTRLVLLVLLLAIGLGFAVAGTVLGIDDSLTDSDPDASFTISENNVTVNTDDEVITAVDRMQSVTEVEISERSGQFVVETDSVDPFTGQEVDQIVTIARQNETVRTELGDSELYEFEVEPIHELEATDIDVHVSENDTHSSPSVDEEFDIDVIEYSDQSNETVRVDRNLSIVENEARVIVRDPGTGDTPFSLVVDLDAERVVTLTDLQDE